MKIEDPGPETLQAATAGNLAVHVLGQRDDAAEATQEGLLQRQNPP